MFSPRLIALLVVRDGQHVQSVGFQRYLPVGSPSESAREYNRWGVDEIVLILMNDAANCARRIVSSVADAIAVPLTVAGGVQSVQDISDYLSGGADKVALNRALTEKPELIGEAAREFGSQCLLASVDAWRDENGLRRYDYWKRQVADDAVVDWVRRRTEDGIGEILLNFPQRDGIREGMDRDAIEEVVQSTEVPVIACGGIGSISHGLDCWKAAKPSGIGVGNLLSHYEHSILLFKEGLRNGGVASRDGVHASYRHHRFDERGCPQKLDDHALDEMLFHRIEPEVI